MHHVYEDHDFQRPAIPSWARTATKAFYWAMAFVILGVLVLVYIQYEEPKQEAASYVRRVIAENDRYKALETDAESVTWDISRKFLNCDAGYSCFTFERTVNVIQGAEVKPLRCEWSVTFPGKVNTASPRIIPTNTEARTFFRVLSPPDQASGASSP